MNHKLTIKQVKNIFKGKSKLSHNREFMHRFLVCQQQDKKYAKRNNIY